MFPAHRICCILTRLLFRLTKPEESCRSQPRVLNAIVISKIKMSPTFGPASSIVICMFWSVSSLSSKLFKVTSTSIRNFRGRAGTSSIAWISKPEGNNGDDAEHDQLSSTATVLIIPRLTVTTSPCRHFSQVVLDVLSVERLEILSDTLVYLSEKGNSRYDRQHPPKKRPVVVL